MDCCCENCGWSEIVGSPIMCNYNGHRTWRDECCEAWKPKWKDTNQEKLVDVDALREKLGLAKDCAKCKQNTRACQYDSHFSLMDFCERFDMAIEELMQEGR